MSNDIIKQLEEEERELQRQLEEKKRARAEAIAQHNKELAEQRLSKPITVLATRTVNGYVEFETIGEHNTSGYREDLVAMLRSFPTWAYRGSRNAMISIAEWDQLVVKSQTLRNITIEYKDGVREGIDKWLHMPAWEITLEQRWLHATPGVHNSRRNILSNIPGMQWNTVGGFAQIPLTEGWNLAKVLEGVENVVWDEAAADFVRDQAERRARIDSVAMQTESAKYMALDLNGNKLYPFQSVGAEFAETAGGRALIADEMGLGKTPQGIAYAWAHRDQNWKTIIICPANLKPNWAREVHKFTGLRPRVWSGLKPSNETMVDAVLNPATFTIINYDILGAATKEFKNGRMNETYVWAELINMAKPDLIIVDEGHYIKNTDSNRSKALRTLNAPRIIFLTGTPVLNRPAELWPMLHMIDKAAFPAFETFVRQYTIDGKRTRNPEELRSILKNIMIRRLKKDVLKDLPKLSRNQIFHELSPKAQKLYEKVLQGVYEQLAEYSPTGEVGTKAVTNILVQIGRLKQICAIDTADRSASLATQLYDETDENSKRKVIIFSQFKAVAYAIHQRLMDQGSLCFVSRTATEFKTANVNECDKMVQQFQNDPSIKYLVVTEKTTKEGHNITEAGHVIFNDLFWTPAGHDQAIGRAYARMSDLHGVDAYFVIAKQAGEDTDESVCEWIWQLLGFKQGVIDETVEGIQDERTESGVAMQLIEKMREAMWTKKRR